jgi:hypothetical protein
MRIASLPGLALGLIVACAPYVVTTPAPAPAPGADIRIATVPDSSHFTRARFVSMDGATLVYERLVLDPAYGRHGWAARSLRADSVAALQVKVGRRSNVGRGALIGAATGLLVGIGCAVEDGGGWGSPSPGACMAAGFVGGAGYGALIGLLIRSDVWGPAVLPPRSPEPPTEPPVTLRR